MIREALELLTRPYRRRRWAKRRERVIEANERWDALQREAPELTIDYNPLAQDEEICCFFPPPAIPCRWEERDPIDVRRDVHRWVEKKRERWNSSHSKAEAFLKKAKRDLKKKEPLDTRWNPLDVDECILLPCRECSSMTCGDPVAHFGLTYEELGFKGGST